MDAAAALTPKVRRLSLDRSRSEDDTIARARRGDADAFQDLVQSYLPRVLSVARSLVGGTDLEAEDIAQEVFFKVHQKLGTFREDSSFYTWLYRVTVNTATDYRKRRRLHASQQTDDFDRLPVADRADQPLAALARADLAREVRDAMAQIPPRFRAVLVLREIEQLTYEDIARTLRCSLGTVESRLFRARARLKAILERRLLTD